MERITSERLKTAEQHAKTLLRSLEQLKEGSIATLLPTDQTSNGPDLRRVSLPRNVKHNGKSKKQDCNNIRCSCGNSAAVICKAKKCGKCCQIPTCNAKHHQRKHNTEGPDGDLNSKQLGVPFKNAKKSVEKASKYVFEDSSDSSDEDLPLGSMKRKRLDQEEKCKDASDENSEGTDEDWTPYASKQKKEGRNKKGCHGDSSNSRYLDIPTNCVPNVTHFPSSLRIPTLGSQGRPDPSKRSANPLGLPLLASPREQPYVLPRPWLSSAIRVPGLTVLVPRAYPNQNTSSSQSSAPSLSSPRVHNPSHILPTSHINSMLRNQSLSVPSPRINSHHMEDSTGSGASVHIQHEDDNCDTPTSELSKEEKELNVLMFYVRYPSSQCCTQRNLEDIFRPYCSLRIIRWIDKRSAYVTISNDATFHTYDGIFMNLVLKSDTENDNSIFVSPYNEYTKKQAPSESISNSTT